MNEDKVLDILNDLKIEFVVSLPCDRTKDLCAGMESEFHYVNINREEDGIGVCAGLALAGRRPLLQMQSSGLGNSMNAVMTLTDLYGLPLPVIASWRGIYKEKISAQIPFNSKVTEMLEVFNISYTIVSDPLDSELIREGIMKAFDNSEVHVILITPKFWEGSTPECCVPAKFPERCRNISLSYEREIKSPVMKRADAIEALVPFMSDIPVICNIGVPCKELYRAGDRPENFYMLGSYTQATPIGFGVALGQEKDVMVVDGDGSLLGTAVLPAVAAESPKNLIIIALDNGAFGSTGMQITHAWNECDLELMAIGAGIMNTVKVHTKEELWDVLGRRKNGELQGTLFIHAVILPGNSDAPNVPLSASEIKDRFLDFVTSKR
jgi:sulfopyruvate decarboxylase subunit beta